MSKNKRRIDWLLRLIHQENHRSYAVRYENCIMCADVRHRMKEATK